MIKIIKEGTRRELTCYDCGCLFSYEAEDVKKEHYGKNEYKDTIECPQCHKNLVIAGTRGF